MLGSTASLTSPAMKPMSTMTPSARKDEEADNWLKLSKLMEWDRPCESIEIDEIDCLFDAC
jgi:hypothetical protein